MDLQEVGGACGDWMDGIYNYYNLFYHPSYI